VKPVDNDVNVVGVQQESTAMPTRNPSECCGTCYAISCLRFAEELEKLSTYLVEYLQALQQ
jgi:hypothetical protein